MVFYRHTKHTINKGDITKAIECYTSALECCEASEDDISLTTTTSTLLSNRAMAHLKSAELLLLSSSSSDIVNSTNDSTKKSSDEQQLQNVQSKLQHCIDDCTLALQQLDSNTTNTEDNEETKLNLRTKLLYRNAKALVTLTNLPSSLSSTSNSSMSNSTNESNLNKSAKLLLQLLQLQPTNKEASI